MPKGRLMSIRSSLRRLVRRFGYDVAPFRPVDCPNLRRQILLDAYRIDTVIDVGANVGQYGRRLRDAGYRGQILSFEPIPDAFHALESQAVADPRWTCEQVAVGAVDGEAMLHVSGNSVSSSLLPTHERLWVKLDVQGYERPVLDGARHLLARTQVVEAELSLVLLYKGQSLYREMIDHLETLGFDLIAMERGFTDPRTGHVLQIDGVFARADGMD